MNKKLLICLLSCLLLGTNLNVNAEEKPKKIYFDPNEPSSLDTANQVLNLFIPADLTKLKSEIDVLFDCVGGDPVALVYDYNDTTKRPPVRYNSKCIYSVVKNKITKKMLFDNAKSVFNEILKITLDPHVKKRFDGFSNFAEFRLSLDEFGNLIKSSRVFEIPEIVVLQIILENEYGYKNKLNKETLGSIKNILLKNFSKYTTKQKQILKENILSEVKSNIDDDKIYLFISDYLDEIENIRDPEKNSDLKIFITTSNQLEKEHKKKLENERLAKDKYIEKQFKLTKIPKKLLQTHLMGSNIFVDELWVLLELLGGTSKLEIVNKESFIIRNTTKNILTNKFHNISILFNKFPDKGNENFPNGIYVASGLYIDGNEFGLAEISSHPFFGELALSPRRIEIAKEVGTLNSSN